MRWKLLVAALTSTVIVLGATGPAMAATQTHWIGYSRIHDRYPVQGDNAQTWYREDTRVGGTVTLEEHFAAPPNLGNGALIFTTNSKDFAKAQLINHATAGTLVSEIQELSYWTYQNDNEVNPPGNTGTANDNASFQLQIDVDGDLNTTADLTNLVYETYWNDIEGTDPQQPLAGGIWQHWEAFGGDWWSNKQIDCGAFSLAPGGGGPPFTRPTEIGTNCASAVVVGIGLNVGSFNPNYVVGADGVHIKTIDADLTYDFEPK